MKKQLISCFLTCALLLTLFSGCGGSGGGSGSGSDGRPMGKRVEANVSEVKKALENAKKGFELGGQASWLPAFIYARRLSEAGRYEEAVEILNLPRRAGDYRAEVVDLWSVCMEKVIEKSIADQRYMQAEDQCKHLLTLAPDNAFAKENLERVRKMMSSKKDKDQKK